jgi:hypothetical protein
VLLVSTGGGDLVYNIVHGYVVTDLREDICYSGVWYTEEHRTGSFANWGSSLAIDPQIENVSWMSSYFPAAFNTFELYIPIFLLFD